VIREKAAFLFKRPIAVLSLLAGKKLLQCPLLGHIWKATSGEGAHLAGQLGITDQVALDGWKADQVALNDISL